VLRWTYHIPTN